MKQLGMQFVICVFLAGVATAQRPTQDHSDVEREPPIFETVPGMPLGYASCFPRLGNNLKVSTMVYELVSGPNLGDAPIREPKAEIERALRDTLAQAYPTWTVVTHPNEADLRIEVVIYRLTDSEGALSWVVRTDWGGPALHQVRIPCVAARVTQTKDLKAELAGIVRLMQTGDAVVRDFPKRVLPNWRLHRSPRTVARLLRPAGSRGPGEP